jgi:hypothetical protein
MTSAIVSYVGFSATPKGREYNVRVSTGPGQPRTFVLFIAHQAFAAGEARFQDAPDLCCARIRRELESDPELASGTTLVLTQQEMLDYRIAHGPPQNRRRG